MAELTETPHDAATSTCRCSTGKAYGLHDCAGSAIARAHKPS